MAGFYSSVASTCIDPSLTVRAGIAYEKSPITDRRAHAAVARQRSLSGIRSAPATSRRFQGLTVDLAYSFIDVQNTPINISPTSGNPWFNGVGTYIGSVEHQHPYHFARRCAIQFNPRRLPDKQGDTASSSRRDAKAGVTPAFLFAPRDVRQNAPGKAPPSIRMFWPVMKPAWAEHRKAQVAPNSPVSPKRFAGNRVDARRARLLDS